MFVVFLRFGSQKTRAAEFMEAHNRWIQEGIAPARADDRLAFLLGAPA